MNKSFLKQTAILVFANSPEEEKRHKSLFHAEDLLQEFTDRTLATVGKAGTSCFHYNEEQQIGENFGERFVNAIQEIFNRGFKYIITVGNDTPQLRSEHIDKALYQLCLGKTVLGPSADGGFYLMGLQKSEFCADEFLALPWQTSSLRSSVILLMHQKAVAVYCLQTLIDIDNINDIRLLTQRTNNILIGIIKYLKRVFGSSLPSENITFRKPSSAFHFPFNNKGSPLLVLQFEQS